MDCSISRCPSKEFECDNGNCILYVYRCDGDNDCKDDTDERCDPYLDHFLIVADNGVRKNLYQIDLHTGVMLPLRVGDSNIATLAFDDRKGDIYWTDSDRNSIQRFSLTRENKTVDTIFKTSDTGTLEGLALDLDNDRLYYCGSNTEVRGHGIIGEMSLSGKDHRIIVSEEGGHPHSVILDTVNRLMYWIDLGGKPSIVRAQMDDGADRTVLVNSNIKAPRAIAIDSQEQVLYWGDAGYHRIERLNLKGNGDRHVILDESDRNASYFAFALSPEFLYLTDRKHGSLRKLDLRTLRVFDQHPTDVFTRLSGVLYYNSYGSTPLARISTMTTAFEPFASANHTEAITLDSRYNVQHTSKDSSVATVITVVVGVVVMTIVITVGVVIVKARRARNRLLFEKRLVVPSVDRGNNSYFYSPFDSVAPTPSEPSPFVGANGEAPSSSFPFSSNPFFRVPASRTSSFKPIIEEDALQTNNVYSTVVGDYENIDTYEIIEDPFV